MRRDNDNWDAPDSDDIIVASDQLTITQVHPNRQLLVSGTTALQACELDLVNWPGDAQGESYALVLRRDRILEVNGPHRPDGWDESTQSAVSDITNGLIVFEIAGPASLNLLKRGGFIDLHARSRSVARQCFGKSVFLYRSGPGQFRLHINRSLAQAMRQLFKSQFATLSELATP